MANCTMLHTAARHSRSDCVPLLLAAGVDVTALNGAQCTALELACEQRDVLTVQLLLDAGGWLPEHGFNCMFNAARAGDVLELLIAAAADTADTAAGAIAGDSSDCSAVARYMRCTSTDGCGYTLMQQCDSGSASGSGSQDDSRIVKVRLIHAVTQQRGSKLYTVDTKLLAQLHASAVAATASAAAAARISSGVIDHRGSSSSSCSSDSSGAVVMAVQESVLMKIIVPPQGWQSTVENGVKLISYDGKCVFFTMYYQSMTMFCSAVHAH
jgi:ankyrin repeat protein